VKGGKLEDTWKELFEPRPELVGKVGMLSDLGEVFVAAAHYLGIDICTEKPEDGQKILDVLTRQKPAVKLYNASGTADRVGAGEVAMQHMWNGAFFRAHKKLATLAYIYPKEGLNLWGDNFAVPKGARNVENAKVFINWMMEPKNIAEASNALGYNNAITGSSQYFIDAMKDEPAINTPEEMVLRLNRPARAPRPIRTCATACGRGCVDSVRPSPAVHKAQRMISTALSGTADYVDSYYARTLSEPGSRPDARRRGRHGDLCDRWRACRPRHGARSGGAGRSVALLESHRVGWARRAATAALCHPALAPASRPWSTRWDCTGAGNVRAVQARARACPRAHPDLGNRLWTGRGGRLALRHGGAGRKAGGALRLHGEGV
jgi:hypothetical protein